MASSSNKPMALAMPFIVLTSGFRGVLEARHAFGIVNLIRLPMGLITFLGPLAVVVYAPSSRLDYIAWVLVIGRIVACAVHGHFAWRILPTDRSALVWRKDLVKVLGVSGGWMTVSNIVGPLMGYLDRFFVGANASAQAVAFYATPQEVISKLSIIPSALMAVLFPQFAQASSTFSKATIDMVERASSLITALCIPAFFFVALFSSEILTIWINPQFAQSSSEILTLIACGMLINSISFIPLTWLQATNYAKTVAIIHIIELPIFSLLLWFGLRDFGVRGAAMAWVARVVLDALLLWFAMAKQECRLFVIARKYVFQSISLGVLIYITALINFSIASRTIIICSVVVYFGHQLIGLVKLESRSI